MATPDNDPNEPLMEGHNYDGIEEYDNPMPSWWVWIFVISIIFAPLYVIGVHVLDVIPDYEERLSAQQADLETIRAAYEAANPTFLATNETLSGFVGDPAHEAAGEATFNQYCAVCHGNAGQGLIGPNLTDVYWIHGNEHTDLYRVITEGVLEKGMTPWGDILSPDERAQLVAYIRLLAGSNPEGAKPPEGERYDTPSA